MHYRLNEKQLFGVLLAMERGIALLNAERDENPEYEKEFKQVCDGHNWLVATISKRARYRGMSYMCYVEYLHDKYISGLPIQDTTGG